LSFSGQAFRALENPFPAYVRAPSVQVDFSSIRDGSIQGRLIFEPIFTNPTESDYVRAEFEFYLLRQAGYGSGNLAAVTIIDSVQIVTVPEPSVVALLTAGFRLMARGSRAKTDWPGGMTPSWDDL